MDYKKIFKTRQSRAAILRKLTFIPDSLMLRLQYRIKLNRALNLGHPVRFTEKLQWYKLHYRNPVMHQCVDKYEVREYVESKGLGDTLVKLYGCYDSIDEIDWNSLPDRFVVKKTYGGGGLGVVLCNNKTKEEIDRIRSSIVVQPGHLGQHGGGREWAYYGLRRRVVVEELLVNEESPEAGINDYKIFCYSGRPKFIIVDIDRYTGHKRNFYDTEWNNLHIESDCEKCDREIPKPENMDGMLKIASKLSEDFPYVRVDLYNLNGKIYFGELTFYPWSGYVQYSPDSADFLFGEDFELVRYKG